MHGRASDKFITEQCGILEKLIPGDIILADCGFTIEDSVGLYCAQVVVPPALKCECATREQFKAVMKA